MKILFCVCASFCCHDAALNIMEELVAAGHSVTPILSEAASTLDTRFGTHDAFLSKISKICDNKPILTIPQVEKTVTSGGFDMVLVEPCTGNTLAKIANGITDGAVTMAVKAMLRNQKPIVIAFSSNDGLWGSFKNIATLVQRKNFYFVPLRQDDYTGKPYSLVCDFSLTEQTLELAFSGKQIQPIFRSPLKKQ